MGLGIDSQSQQRFSKYSDFFFKWSLTVTPWSWRKDFHAATAPWWLHSSLSADIRWIQNRNLKGESLHALLPNLLIHSYSLTPRIRPSLLNPPGHGRLLSSTERKRRAIYESKGEEHWQKKMSSVCETISKFHWWPGASILEALWGLHQLESFIFIFKYFAFAFCSFWLLIWAPRSLTRWTIISPFGIFTILGLQAYFRRKFNFSNN